MKRIALVIGILALILAAAWAQVSTPKPNPEQKQLEIWLGTWTYEGEAQQTPLGPAGKYTGKATVSPLFNGLFVEWRGEEKGTAGEFQWSEIDGYDAVNKKFVWYSFGSEGEFNTAHYTIEANAVNYAGTTRQGDKEYKFRGTCVFAPNRMTWTEKREVTLDGKAWLTLFENKYTNVKTISK